MAQLVFIGDVHGKFDLLLGILNEYSSADRVYQAGDFAIGFPGIPVPSLPQNFRFIRGNHDNPEAAREHPNYLGEYGVDEFGVGFISGAKSIDAHSLTQGVDWWVEEEMPYRELDKAITEIVKAKPKIILSHCVTAEFEEELVNYSYGGSSTTQALDAIVDQHKPEHWICGHYHNSKSLKLSSVRYKCLDELEILELEI